MTAAGDAPLVSVVMIFRDALPFLDEAVASVLAQAYQRLELVLVDDGSTDGSAEAAAVHAAAHADRVRLIRHPGGVNRGMSASRNLGIAAARGELIAFLDADDVWDPGHLEAEVGLLRTHPEAGMVCGRALTWRSWDGSGAGDEWSPLPFAPGTVVAPPKMLLAVLRRGAYSTRTCSLLVRASVLREVGPTAERFSGMYEDQVLLAGLYLSAPAVISGSLTARYRQHARSASAVAHRAGYYDPSAPNAAREAYLRWLDGLPLLTSAEADAELRAALNAELLVYQAVHVPTTRRLRGAIRRALPAKVRRRLRRFRDRPPRRGRVRFGSLRRLVPISRQFGFDRGQPVDRWYIERFLEENALAITGRVLEVGDASYTRRFGAERVVRADVLNVRGGDPETTFVSDLATGEGLPSEAFDCIVLTQVLQLVFDLPAAVRTLHRVLRPGGTVLATVPGISPLSDDLWAANWCWAITPHAATRLFGEVFGLDNIEVRSHGNVLSATAFLQGLSTEDLRPGDVFSDDPQFPLVVTVRAFRPGSGSSTFGNGAN